MRISELSRQAGVPISSIKFYIRTGLLPAGVRVSRNRSDYDDEHVRRLTAIGVLRHDVGMSIEAVRAALADEQAGTGDGIASAARVVERRWTLAVLAALRSGPLRFVDLRAAVPGISPNVLSARLRDLTHENVVDRHRLPAPAASRVYELTERGRNLAVVVTALEHWGLAA